MPNPEMRELPITRKPTGVIDASNNARSKVIAIRLLAATAALALPFDSDAEQAVYEQIKGGTVKGHILDSLLTANIESNGETFKISGWKVRVDEETMNELEGNTIEGELVWATKSPDGKLFAASIKLTAPIDVTLTTSCCGPGAKPKNGVAKEGGKGAPKGIAPQESGYKLEPKLRPYDPGTFLVDNPNVESEKVREDQGLPHAYEVKPGQEFTFHVTSGSKDLTLVFELYPEYEKDGNKDPIRKGETRTLVFDTDFEVVLDDKEHVVVPGKIKVTGKPLPKSIKRDETGETKTDSAVLCVPVKVGPIKIPANSGFHEVTVKIGSGATAYFVILKGAPETASLAPFPALDRDTVDDPEMPAEFETPFKVWRDPGAANGYRVEFLADNTEVENSGDWRGFKVSVVPDGFPHLLIRLTKGEEGKNDFVVYESGRVTPEYFRQWQGAFARTMPATRSTDPAGPQEVQANFLVKPVVTNNVTTYEATLRNPEAFTHAVRCQVNHVMQQGALAATNLFCREKTALKVDPDQESRFRAYRARLDTRAKVFGAAGGAGRRYRLRKY